MGEGKPGAAPLRHLPPFRYRMRDAITPTILKQLHEMEIKELLDRALAKDSRLSIAWWWLDARGAKMPDDPKAAQAHRAALEKETRRMLSELAHTDAGFQLLKDLVNAHPKWVVMNNWDGKTNQTDIDGDLQNAYEKKDGTPSLGGNAVIKMNPTLTTYATPGGKELPWMTERVQFGLYHELVHAWHIQHGTLARGLHNGVDNSEWQTIGLGPYANLPITENKIREQLGKDPRPEFDGKTY